MIRISTADHKSTINNILPLGVFSTYSFINRSIYMQTCNAVNYNDQKELCNVEADHRVIHLNYYYLGIELIYLATVTLQANV